MIAFVATFGLGVLAGEALLHKRDSSAVLYLVIAVIVFHNCK